MSARFVSLIGTQVMGTVQVFGALARQINNFESYLLATDYVYHRAEIIQDFAKSNGWGNVTIIRIPSTLTENGNAPEVMQKIAEGADRIYCCLDGGMNFMICACALAIAPLKPVFIDASKARILAYDSLNGNHAVWPMPEPLPVEEIFSLQEVPYTLSKAPNDLFQFCQKQGIELPKGTLCGVTIDDIVFDFVWNPGNNRLTFLKDCRFPSSNDAKRLAEERNIAHWTSDRKRSGQMYDRVCVAIVRDGKSEEHLLKESDKKLKVINVKSANGRIDYNKLKKDLCDRFSWKPLIDASYEIKKPKNLDLSPMQDKTLVMALGRNIESSLVAICSHKCKHLVICYTDKDTDVAKHYETIKKESASLGLESVVGVPTTIECAYLDLLLPKAAEGAEIAVNISPGSKAQGVRLALWAQEHGYCVWTIDNTAGQCTPILQSSNAEKPVSLRFCDPAVLFTMKDQEILDSGILSNELPDLEMIRGLLKLMRKAVANGTDHLFFNGPLREEDMFLRRKDSDTWIFSIKDQEYELCTRGGEWVEHLTAEALKQAGANYVRARMRLRWNETNEQNIIDRYGEELAGRIPHRLDLDVVGTLRNNLILISCKSFFHDIIAPADEVLYTGTSLGRFSLRMLAHMGCKEAHLHKGQVMIFGWRDLCQPERLREFINKLRRTQSTKG